MTWYRNVKRVEDSRWNAGFGALVVLLLEPWHEVLVCIDGQLQPSTFSCTSPDSSSDGFHGYMEWTYILHVSYMFKPSMWEIKWCSRMFFPSRVYPHILIPRYCVLLHTNGKDGFLRFSILSEECSAPNVSSGTTPSCLEGDVIAHGRQGDFPSTVAGWKVVSSCLVPGGLEFQPGFLAFWRGDLAGSLEFPKLAIRAQPPIRSNYWFESGECPQRWFSWKEWWRSIPCINESSTILGPGDDLDQHIDTLAIHVNLFAFRFLTLLACGS